MRILLNCRGRGLHGCCDWKKTRCDVWVAVDETDGCERSYFTNDALTIDCCCLNRESHPMIWHL